MSTLQEKVALFSSVVLRIASYVFLRWVSQSTYKLRVSLLIRVLQFPGSVRSINHQLRRLY